MNGNKIILLDDNEMLKFCSYMSSQYQKKAKENKDNRNETHNKQGGKL